MQRSARTSIIVKYLVAITARFQIVSLFILCACVAAFGQTTSPSPTPIPTPDDQDKTTVTKNPTDTDKDPKPKKEKRGEIILAPIPILSPTFGAGAILGAGYVFQLKETDTLSQPSVIGAAVPITDNGSRGIIAFAKLNFAENKYRTMFALGKGRANLEFFGVGRIPGRPPISVFIKGNAEFVFGEGLRNVWKDIFIGPRYQYRRITVNTDREPPPGGFVIPQVDLKSTTAALGFRVLRDLRDSSFYPTKGVMWDFKGDFFAKPFGSNRSYQTYKATYNGFKTIGDRQVLAYRGMACSVSDLTPFYDLCLFGGSDLRGYTTGQFQNHRMFAVQAEYRRELWWRLGVVGFGGIGGVARHWNEFRSDGLLPAAGAGLRINLNKKNHINYRIDLGYGRVGATLQMSVTEAF